MRRAIFLLSLPLLAERPVGIVLSAEDAQIQAPGTASWIGAAAGVDLKAKSRVRAGKKPVTFAFCPERVAVTLSPGQEIAIPDAHLTSGFSTRPIPACDLPDVPALAATRGGNDTAVAPSSSPKADLLESISAARKLEQQGEYAAASTQYKRIATEYPEAVWTRGVIANLTLRGKASEGQGKTYALLIGISQYPEEVKQGSLQFADADAKAFGEFLRSAKGGAIPPEQIRLLTNQQATRDGVENAVNSFVKESAGPQNTLIMFVAAHGDYLTTEIDPATGREIQKDPYIITADTSGQDVKTTGFPMSEFRNLIAEQALLFKRVIVYLDICHAGYVRGVAGEQGLQPAVKRVFSAREGEVGLMMASDSDGFAYEADQFGGGHGAFTYYVLDGLNGGAARKGDPAITFAGLYRHVVNGVGEITNNAQSPDKFATNDQMAVLDDVTREPGITLLPAKALPESATRRRRGQPPQTTAKKAEEARNSELRVSLEERGQQVILQYLRGEQIPQTKASFEQGAQLFEQALQLAPLSTFDESRMWFCRGRALIFDKSEASYAQAQEYLERSIRLDPQRAYAYNALGIAYLEQVRRHPEYYRRAVDAFQDAVRFAPAWAYPRHNLALAYSERGDFAAAVREYRQAMQLAPTYAYLPYNLALLHQRMNRLEEAAALYRVALGLAADAHRRADVRNALGSIEMAKSHDAAAQKFFEEALADDPQLAAAKHNLAIVLTRKQRSARAEQLWRESGTSASKLALAAYFEKNGSAEDAIQQYRELIATNPEHTGARAKLADLYAKQNRWADALEQLQEVARQSPSDPATLEKLGDAAAKSGRAPESSDAYRKALALYTDKRDRKRVDAKLR